MDIVKVREILHVDTISKSTNAWKELIQIADKAEGDILFDFRGIQLIEPWLNEDFKQLMKNERVYLKVYTAETVRDTIELMLAFGNLKTNRVENEDILADPVLSERDKKILDVMRQIESNMTINGGKAEIELGRMRSYITESLTVDGLGLAIDNYVQEKGIKEFRVGLTSVTITDPMLLKLAELINNFDSKGIVVEMTSEDDEVINKIITFQCVGSKQLSVKERYEIFKDTVKPKTVGMFARYARTGRLDSLGRMGDGKPVMCRPAIFDGFVKKSKDDVLRVKFITFPASTFYTKQDYYLDNDGAILSKIKTEVMCVPITDIGLCDRFTGREYHFNMPIQLNPDEGHMVYRMSGGKVETVKLILPEYIKRVLDDHDIDYDRGALLDAIVENKKLLKEKFGTNAN